MAEIDAAPARAGEIVFTGMERVVFGRPAAEAVVEAADRLGAKRVFILAGRTLNRETDAVRQIETALGPRYAGLHDDMPSHSPRDAVIACANKAREAGCDLLLSVGGGSATDGGKAVTICLEHDIREPDGLEPFRTVVDEITGKRSFPQYRAPRVRQICVPTTLSGGEFNARAGITEPRLRLKQAYIHPGLIPLSVIFDPAITRHTPEWLWLSTGIRAVDHAVETYCSIDGNAYTDSTALQALRLLGPRPAGDETRSWRPRGAARLPDRRLDLDDRHCRRHAHGGEPRHRACAGRECRGAAWLHFLCPCFRPCWHSMPRSMPIARRRSAPRWAQPASRRPKCSIASLRGLALPRRLRDVGVKREDLPRIATNCMLDDWTFSNPRRIQGAQEIVPILEAVY